MLYTLHFDGSCWPNPGGKCGYGWHCSRGDDRIAAGQGEVFDEPRTNNVGEFRGLIAALEFAVCLTDAKLIVIRGDSLLVVKCANRRMKSKKPHLQALILKVHVLLSRLAAPWIVEWVGREQNSEADRLADII